MAMRKTITAPIDTPHAIFSTNEAAEALNRRPQTLRKWACLEIGPIRPIRINGRLAWRTSDIIALLNGGHTTVTASKSEGAADE